MSAKPITDPNGRLADLARHVTAELEAIYRDPEPLTDANRGYAARMYGACRDVADSLDGYTEMPDAKRARETEVRH